MKGKETIIYILLGFIPVVWLALLIAPCLDEGLVSLVKDFPIMMEHPLKITMCEDSLKTILIFIGTYLIGIGIYQSTKRNYRRGAEMGSARWGNAETLNSKYASKDGNNNILLTQNVKMGLDGRVHKRNLNVLVVGGSGAQKTRGYCKPNIMQMACSVFCLDPKGELLRSTGGLLEKNGYTVRVLDLINMDKSHSYNPFVYLQDDNDVQKLVTNLFKSTTPKNSTDSDPFWDKAAQMLLLAIIYYLKYEAPEEEQNFAMVMEMLRACEIDEDSESDYSPLDRLFFTLGDENPTHIAYKYYKGYRAGSSKTLKSIQITLTSRLEKFNLESISALTMVDELELDKMGERKTALFAIIPDNDTSFNFLVSILYTQLFQQLFYVADNKYDGRLPIHVHLIMDEFANLELPSDFDKILAVMRSREVSVSIILQNMAQLKALFEKEHESITGNCDTFLYLGGNEFSTQKYVSELLGKETIDTNSHNRSYGRNGSYSTGYQLNGRELLDASEVRMLDNNYALLFIRGESCVKDLKYDLTKHPNVSETEDGGAEAFEHGKVKVDTNDIVIEDYFYVEGKQAQDENIEIIETGYEILSEEDFLKEIESEGKENGKQEQDNEEGETSPIQEN